MFYSNALPGFRFISRNQQILRHIHRGNVYSLSSSQTTCRSTLNKNHHLLQRTSFTSQINKVNTNHLTDTNACKTTYHLHCMTSSRLRLVFNAGIHYSVNNVLIWNIRCFREQVIALLFCFNPDTSAVQQWCIYNQTYKLMLFF